jgi:hypothetical protein
MNARTPPGLTVYILWSTACVTAGWLLSALGQLRGAPWLLVLLPVAVALAGTACRKGAEYCVRPLHAWRRRIRRPLPLVFALLAMLSLLGGLLHAPNNYDALTYRLPRLLHWLAEGRWHWIATPNLRMNLSAANTEWLLAPWLAWFHSDRPLFLLNWMSYLFLPGLIFSVFQQAGVSRRVAWWWMWLLPSGYGYVLQSGSLGNDLPGTVYLLAAIHYAWRARTTGAISLLFLSVLSAALLSGTKVTNLPLLLPVGLTLLPVLPLCRSKITASLAVLALAAAVSFLPTAILNHRHTGHWSGDPADAFRVQADSPWAALAGNMLQVTFRNLEPPVLPGARRLDAVLQSVPTPESADWIRRHFPRFSLRPGELPQEEGSALGLGVTAMLVVSGFGALRGWGRWSAGRAQPGLWWGLAGWLAMGVFLAKVAVEATPRLLLPYYVLLPLPFLLLAPPNRLVRRGGWRWGAAVAAASAVIGLILTPSRPLWPALTLTARIPESGAAQRVRAVYATYAQRNDALAPLRRHLPESAVMIGYIGGLDDTEYALWRPLGERRVVHLFDGKRIETRQRPPTEWVVVKEEVWREFAGVSFDQWLVANGGERVAEETITSKVSAGPETWWVARFPVRP